ncbi:D-Ala-D-Ala carboxypeptidase [Paenibacillus sp. J31TS4]|uniref:serine hydrolase domain-containing protein n=1 Tax=Paenibacillus sp. J31TS4 TaxID=2807195 RepID=UPI001B104E8C|nr:serine hydrolase domain-containing protein [Paenibacillus sp. J31TS4]GIP39908.1 D-Ala-D-Ala carboxypeptidase [Paenibacillus sp. J31TS4]
MDATKAKTYEAIFDKTMASPLLHEGAVLLETADGSFSWSRGYAGKEVDSPLLMASITKLFTTSCLLTLRERGKLSLDDPLSAYFAPSLLEGLHRYKGQDYSSALTLSDLLFQVSGLPDKYEEKKDSLKRAVIREDFAYTFDELLQWTKALPPHFAPRTKGKAYYNNINFDLLGEVIEKVTDLPLAEAYEQLIFAPLGLEQTYLPHTGDEAIPSLYCRGQVLKRPQFIRSCRASGGAVSTAREMMVFLKGFWSGRLFDRDILGKLMTYNRLQLRMGPLHYGGGFMRVALGGLLMPFAEKGDLLGHSGSTGSFAFYYPQRELYLVGDLNQMANPALPIRLSMRLALASQ